MNTAKHINREESIRSSTSHNLNILPATTYRWLKLNQLQLEIPDWDSKHSYHKEFLKNSNYDINEQNTKDIVLKKMDASLLLPNHIKASLAKKIEYGVSKEVIEECERSYNSGVFVQVGKEKTILNPIRIDYALDQDNPQVTDFNLIYAEANSKLTIIMDYSNSDNSETIHKGATQIIAKEGSEVTLVKIQRMNDKSHHFDSIFSTVDYNATVNYIQVELGSKNSVTNYKSILNEAGKADLASIYFGDGKRTIDLNYLMEHKGRRSISNIQTKGALKDTAVKTFRGTIDFQLGASKSEGAEEEYVILLDKKVKSNAIPLLLCSEDDVKGHHAASAGKVDKEKLFYMMSRGFCKEEALKMIVEASFLPTIEKIADHELRSIIQKEIHRRLMNEKL